MLMGIYSHSLDEKGRLIIPSKLRDDLGADFVLTKSLDHCLAIYPKAEWQKLIEKMNTLPKISSEPARKLRRFYFGNSVVLEVDKQGRTLIPANLREFAGLTKEITLVGVDDHVEVWDTAAWSEYNRSLDLSDIVYDLNGMNL